MKGKAWAGYLELKPQVILIHDIAIRIMEAAKNNNAGAKLFLMSCRMRVSIKYKPPKNKIAPQTVPAQTVRIGGKICSMKYFIGRYRNKSYLKFTAMATSANIPNTIASFSEGKT